MNFRLTLGLLLLGFLLGCTPHTPEEKDVPSPLNRIDSGIKLTVPTWPKPTETQDTYALLTAQMKNPVVLDDLLDRITHQEKVKVISNLSELEGTKEYYEYGDI